MYKRIRTQPLSPCAFFTDTRGHSLVLFYAKQSVARYCVDAADCHHFVNKQPLANASRCNDTTLFRSILSTVITKRKIILLRKKKKMTGSLFQTFACISVGFNLHVPQHRLVGARHSGSHECLCSRPDSFFAP
jgi:hypothetical protein